MSYFNINKIRLLTKKLLISALLIFTAIGLANAAVTATIDRNDIKMGETFTLSLSTDKSSNSQPDFSVLNNDFDIISTSTNSAISFINGKQSAKTGWDVTLRAKNTGKITIPSIKIGAEQTEPLDINIAKPDPADPNATANSDVAIEIQTSTAAPFVQQNFYITVKLIYDINIYSGDLTSPKAKNLVVKQFGKDRQYQTKRNNKTYQVLERKYIVYAEKSGEIQVTPLVLNGQTRGSIQNPFGAKVYQTSPALLLNIKPIPAEFANKTWLASSDIKLKQTWTDKPYKVGDAITRTITLTAKDLNENQLPDLKLADIPDVKQYNDTTQSKANINNGQLVAEKTFKIVIIPEHSGDLTIPKYTLSWFNTTTKTEQITTIPATTLHIDANPDQISTITSKDNSQSPTNSVKATETKPINKPDSPKNNISAANTTQIATNKNAEKWQKISLYLVILVILVLLAIGYLMLKLKQLNNKINNSLDDKNSKEIAKTDDNAKNKIANFNPKDDSAKSIQIALLAWWNAKYQQQTAHLGQIIEQLDNNELINSVNQLQKSIYAANTPNSVDVDLEKWKQLIKNKDFAPQTNNQQIKNDKNKYTLPSLYD